MRIAGLASGFIDSSDRFARRNALFVNGRFWTYHDLRSAAAAIAATIEQGEPADFPLAAVFAFRSATAYAGVLGILGAGKGYVPLNPRFPLARTRKMLELSGCSVVVVGPECAGQLPELLPEMNRGLTLIFPEEVDLRETAARFPQHHFVKPAAMAGGSQFPLTVEVDPEAVAYLLFTSGSTGVPKGVPISHASARSYVDHTVRRYQVRETDRFSQAFDMTFDLSVHDMFVCWERGACLYSVPERATMLPAKFIRDHALTMWFSVPSVIGLLAKTGLLRPGCFPTLRSSLFCGEPLPGRYAQLWQDATPNAIVENLYGPTEATIAISHYRWHPDRSPEECVDGIVPLGWIFHGQGASVVDDQRNPVCPGEPGELCLHGSQLARGYWNDPEKTRQQFVNLPGGPDGRCYRTGDRVRQRPDGCLIYLGRIDEQVKIRGYRVELQEIEGVLRIACGTDHVAALGWPSKDGTALGLVAFVAGPGDLKQERVVEECRRSLPDYMIPERIHFVAALPRNANGKLDRKQLARLLEET